MTDRFVPLMLSAWLVACSNEVPPVPPGTPPNDAELAQRLFDTYSSWTANDALSPECAVYFSACADVFARRAGSDPKDLKSKNPRAFMVNPDPAWLTGWDQLPEDDGQRHVTLGALTYAASLRAYFNSCDATAQEVAGQRAIAQGLLDAELNAAKNEPNAYKRIGALVRLRQELKKKHPDPVGPRYQLEQALFDEFQKSGRGLIYDLRKQRPDDIGTLRPAFSAADERDLLCLDGLPSWQDHESIPQKFVRAPVSAARRDELLARIKKAQDLAEKIPAREATVESMGSHRAPGKGELLSFEKSVLGAPLHVKKVGPDDRSSGLLVELVGKALVKDAPYDCKESDKPSKVGPDGKVHYPTDCKRRDEQRNVRVRLVLAERPDFSMQADDQVTFLGKLTKLSSKPGKPDKNKITPVDIEIEAEGTHVLEIWRQQLLAADYF